MNRQLLLKKRNSYIYFLKIFKSKRRKKLKDPHKTSTEKMGVDVIIAIRILLIKAGIRGMSFSELSMQVHSNSRPVKRASYFQLMAANPFLPCSCACFTPVETRGDSNFFRIECTRTPFWLIAASVTWSFVGGSGRVDVSIGCNSFGQRYLEFNHVDLDLMGF